MPPAPRPVADRLADRGQLQPETGCIVWTGHRSVGGYGRIVIDGVTRYVHRVSYELNVGPIPDGYEVHHLCSNPPCFNVSHLTATTPGDNARASSSPPAQYAHRTHCPNGHAFAEHGRDRRAGQGRMCVTCRRDYKRAYDARKRTTTTTTTG